MKCHTNSIKNKGDIHMETITESKKCIDYKEEFKKVFILYPANMIGTPFGMFRRNECINLIQYLR